MNELSNQITDPRDDTLAGHEQVATGGAEPTAGVMVISARSERERGRSLRLEDLVLTVVDQEAHPSDFSPHWTYRGAVQRARQCQVVVPEKWGRVAGLSGPDNALTLTKAAVSTPTYGAPGGLADQGILGWHVRSELLHGSLLGAGNPLGSRLEGATTAEAVASVLRNDTQRVAARIEDLKKLREEEGGPGIDVESLKAMVTTMLQHQRWGAPNLTLTEAGYVTASWNTASDGRIAMTFLPDGMSSFAATECAPGSGDAQSRRVSGRLKLDEALAALRPLTITIHPR